MQFSDGRKATTVRWWSQLSRGEPTGPLLVEAGSSAGDRNWDGEFWLWPLPPPGTLTFAIEWPSEGLHLTKHDVDAALFTEASKQSEALWPESGSGHASASRDTIFLIPGDAEFGAREPEGYEHEESPGEPDR